ncbi:MAG: hypothetical protein QOH08_381 [Chloroflexota bacterium]|nr:hypothetical protein [Chloroflexota bacterium]
MRGLRVAASAILAVGLLASGATSVSANDTPVEESIPPGPGLVELKQAISDFRSALVELRDACRAEREAPAADVTTARKRLPKADSECVKNLKALKAEFQDIRQKALDLEATYRADVKQKRVDAEQAAKQKEAAAKQKLAAEQRNQEELARKAAQTPKPTPSASDQLAKKQAKLTEQLKQVDATLAYKQGLLKQSTDAAAEYRAKAATLTGADRDKFLAKAAQADKDAAQWAAYVKEYTAQHDQLVADLAKLGTTVVPVSAPKPSDVATKRAKLEQSLRDLNDKVTYKWSESDRYAAMATDFRSQAAAATSQAMKDLFNAKAADADTQADDWANLARQYEDQRDAVQAQLDALTA